jgi:hypothetical protein
VQVQPLQGLAAIWMHVCVHRDAFFDQSLHQGEELTKEGVVKFVLNIPVRERPIAGIPREKEPYE